MFDFPSNPILNEEVVLDTAAYIWDGQKWRAKRSQPPCEPAPLIARSSVMSRSPVALVFSSAPPIVRV